MHDECFTVVSHRKLTARAEIWPSVLGVTPDTATRLKLQRDGDRWYLATRHGVLQVVDGGLEFHGEVVPTLQVIVEALSKEASQVSLPRFTFVPCFHAFSWRLQCL